MSLEKIIIQKPKETVEETQAIARQEERELSREEKRIIIEESLRNLREGAEIYNERQRRLEEAIKKLL